MVLRHASYLYTCTARVHSVRCRKASHLNKDKELNSPGEKCVKSSQVNLLKCKNGFKSPKKRVILMVLK